MQDKNVKELWVEVHNQRKLENALLFDEFMSEIEREPTENDLERRIL